MLVVGATVGNNEVFLKAAAAALVLLYLHCGICHVCGLWVLVVVTAAKVRAARTEALVHDSVRGLKRQSGQARTLPHARTFPPARTLPPARPLAHARPPALRTRERETLRSHARHVSRFACDLVDFEALKDTSGMTQRFVNSEQSSSSALACFSTLSCAT
eukprot:5064027-Pleurochrysis_carterae.AAC.1